MVSQIACCLISLSVHVADCLYVYILYVSVCKQDRQPLYLRLANGTQVYR